ncbi:MAG TPA: hypothetical protein VGH28_14645 [Polyangiaceae bacterium]
MRSIALSICALACACGGSNVEVREPSHEPVVRVASLCHDRSDVAAPPPRVVAGYPLAIAVLSKDEMAARAAAAKTADWPQIQVDRYGLLETAGTRPHFRTPGYSEGPSETGERPEDVTLVQAFVDAHPTLFGPDPSDRVAGHGRIGTDYIVRYWGNGVISMQSMHTARLFAILAAGRTMPAPRDRSDLLAPWVGTEIVNVPRAPENPPCDPITPSGRECAHDEPVAPPPSRWKLDATRATNPVTSIFRDEPPVLRRIVQVTLSEDDRPCRKLPHFIDAVTGEVLEWTPAITN